MIDQMTSEEMANDEVKKQREQFVQEGIKDSRLAQVEVRQRLRFPNPQIIGFFSTRHHATWCVDKKCKNSVPGYRSTLDSTAFLAPLIYAETIFF